jgi:hypothetical protein
VTDDLISRKTCNAFREFLVKWSLREIADAFRAAEVECDGQYAPPTSGQRRILVEQYYHTLDLSRPEDTRRLVAAFQGILETAQRQSSSAIDRLLDQEAIAELVSHLKNDGLKYELGKVVATSARARQIFGDAASARTISEVTRRNIVDEIRVAKVPWWGRLDEVEFLSRLYDLEALPSNDRRVQAFSGDIWQHRCNNHDWPDDWVFTDSRTDLMHAQDDAFLRFVCLMIHPAVRPEQAEVDGLLAVFNKYLSADRWEIAASGELSGRPVYSGRRQGAAQVHLGPSTETIDVLSDDYVQDLSHKCNDRLAKSDFDGAITTGRTVLEAILAELELRLAGSRGDYKGDLPKQFKKVAKLLKMDDERPDLDDRFKDVVRGLVMVTHGLAPLRNKMGDGHARERKPAPHHARVVVNAAKTVALFLVESYVFQQKKGLLDRVPFAKVKEGISAQ